MTVTTSSTRPILPVDTPGARRPPLALAVTDSNWFTTEHLFAATPEDRAATLMLTCIDYLNAWRRGSPPWKWGSEPAQRAPGIWQADLVLPSGWMKTYPKVGMRPIAKRIASWRAQHVPHDAPLALVITYPHYVYLHAMLRPEILVYLNVDDYTLYWPRCAKTVRALELECVRRADLTVCVSRLRRDELRAAVPEASDRIEHLPHGCPSAALSPKPLSCPAHPPADIAHLPRPLLGFVGSIEDRIDWRLLERVAHTFPHASLVLIGRTPPPNQPSADWLADFQRLTELSNVHMIGWRPQEHIHEYIRAFDICLIPYRTDHPFNRACCPTKIMDYMGTGRPIVSTALPECRLYGDLFDVGESAAGFVENVGSLLATGSDDGRSAARHAWAETHTCRSTIEQLLAWLPDRAVAANGVAAKG